MPLLQSTVDLVQNSQAISRIIGEVKDFLPLALLGPITKISAINVEVPRIKKAQDTNHEHITLLEEKTSNIENDKALSSSLESPQKSIEEIKPDLATLQAKKAALEKEL